MSFEIEWEFEDTNPTIPSLIIGRMRIHSPEVVLPEAETGVAEDTIGYRPAISYSNLVESVNRLFIYENSSSAEVTFGETKEALLLEKESGQEIVIRYADSYESRGSIEYGQSRIHAQIPEFRTALIDCHERLMQFARQNDVSMNSHMRRLVWETRAAERIL